MLARVAVRVSGSMNARRRDLDVLLSGVVAEDELYGRLGMAVVAFCLFTPELMPSRDPECGKGGDH